MARPASLGRGLDALIPRAASTTPVPADIPIDRIERNPYQPRTVFEVDQLDQLRASIVAHGVLQPVLVTETLEGYRLIAGEQCPQALADQLALAGVFPGAHPLTQRISHVVRKCDAQLPRRSHDRPPLIE